MSAFDVVVGTLQFVARSAIRLSPFFVLSVVISVVAVRSRLRTVLVEGLQRRPRKAIVFATLLGALSPLCSCGVIPLVSSLLLLGVPLAPVMAFWITSPLIDPGAFIMTAGIFGWPFAVERLAAAIAVGLLSGWLTAWAERRDLLGGRSIRLGTARPRHGRTRTANSRAEGTVPAVQRGSVSAFLREAWSLGAPLGGWLLLAFALEALMVRYVPASLVSHVLGRSSPYAVPLAAAIGIPLYMNNISALPIVHNLSGAGMSPGATLAFLIGGPVTSVPAMLAVWAIAGRRVFVTYLTLGLLGAIAVGYLRDLIQLFVD